MIEVTISHEMLHINAYCELFVPLPQNPYVKILTPNVMVLRGGVFRRLSGTMRVETSCVGLVPF